MSVRMCLYICMQTKYTQALAHACRFQCEFVGAGTSERISLEGPNSFNNKHISINYLRTHTSITIAMYLRMRTGTIPVWTAEGSGPTREYFAFAAFLMDESILAFCIDETCLCTCAKHSKQERKPEVRKGEVSKKRSLVAKQAFFQKTTRHRILLLLHTVIDCNLVHFLVFAYLCMLFLPILCLCTQMVVCCVSQKFARALPIPAPLVGEGIPSPNSQFWCGESLPYCTNFSQNCLWCGDFIQNCDENRF